MDQRSKVLVLLRQIGGTHTRRQRARTLVTTRTRRARTLVTTRTRRARTRYVNATHARESTRRTVTHAHETSTRTNARENTPTARTHALSIKIYFMDIAAGNGPKVQSARAPVTNRRHAHETSTRTHARDNTHTTRTHARDNTHTARTHTIRQCNARS